MIYDIHIPCFPLNQFVESFIYYKDYNPVHSVDRFLPDGNINLVIDLTDYPKYIYDNYTLQEIQACNNVWFSGIRNNFITIPSGRDSEMFIINFQKGKAYPFTGMPLHEFTDHVVDGELAMTNEILHLRERLLCLREVQQKFRFAEQHLLKVFGWKLQENPFVDYAVNQIVRMPHQAVIEHISNKVGYSQKHFIKIFKEHVGMAPKAFLKVMRFQKAISEIEQQKTANWTRIANESGYYDQAHFINDFKNFSGFTPSQYLSKQTDFTNYVAVG
jgi:AraC-like DNA-binding protein